MIEIKSLTKRYDTIHALKGIDLHVDAGELFAYLGPNGSGKTTTVRILTGLARPTSGDAWLNGFHIEQEAIQAKMQSGLVPQTINLDPELTVYQNLDLHGRLFHMPRRQRASRIGELIEYVGLADRRDSLVRWLSGGMKRRVMVARAMVHSPAILFLDEPTAGLDPTIRRRIWSLIKMIQQSGATIFLTTHYIEEAEFLANRVAFLDQGRIVAVNSPQSFIHCLGTWALDQVVDGNMETTYFSSEAEADSRAGRKRGSFCLRRVNLEDVFVSIIRRGVDPCQGAFSPAAH